MTVNFGTTPKRDAVIVDERARSLKLPLDFSAGIVENLHGASPLGIGRLDNTDISEGRKLFPFLTRSSPRHRGGSHPGTGNCTQLT